MDPVLLCALPPCMQRNPDVKLYGLSWGFPSWVGNGSGDPYKYPNLTASYIVQWITGAKQHHGLDIDYIGVGWDARGRGGRGERWARSVL